MPVVASRTVINPFFVMVEEEMNESGMSQVGVKHTKLLQQACFIYFIKEKEIKTQIKIELQISSPKTPQRKPWLHHKT